LRWEGARQAAGDPVQWQNNALLLYRLGRYKESLTALQQEAEEEFPAQVACTLLTAVSAATTPLHRIAASAHPKNQIPARQYKSLPDLVAMCYHKLGQPELSQLYLAYAATQAAVEAKKSVLEKGETLTQGFSREIPLYREALELITGKPPSK
jgi:hypothetical protein